MSRSYRHGKYKFYRNYYYWSHREPKWWRKLMKHRKRRASCRRCEYEVRIGEIDTLWPLDKKPWQYYW